MEIMNIQQIFNEKLQNIQAKVPEQGNVNNKFQSLLENAQLTVKSQNVPNSENIQSSADSSNTDTTKMLAALLSQQSNLSTSSLLSGDQGNSNASSIFPTSAINSSLMSLQQTALLKSLKDKE